MKKSLVSVITVTYNAEAFLEETIQSVLNQTYHDIEYIIIDGNSTDHTLEIIKQNEDKIDHWISEPDEGIYFAMNKAIDQASGEWISFMNAGDTYFDLDTVSYVMRSRDEDADLVYGNCQIGSRVKKPHDISGYNNLTSVCHQTLFVKTDLIKKSPFDTKYKISADHDFILKMFREKKNFQYLDRSIANYLLEGLSDTETLRLYIEGLSILFTNNVPENEILISPWYKDLSMNISRTHVEHINILKQKNSDQEKIIDLKDDRDKQLSMLQEAVKRVMSYSIWKQPLKKYQSYKTMLLAYRNIKKSLKGARVEKK